MTARARIFVSGVSAGLLEKTGDTYVFTYDDVYPEDGRPVSLTMPPSIKRHAFPGRLPPFFEGLMYEGWMRRLASEVGTESGESDSEGSGGPIAYLIHKCADSIGDVEIAPETASAPQKVEPISFADPASVAPSIPRKSCLVCFSPLPSPGHNRNYHESCSQSFFGTDAPPVVPFGAADIERLAVRSISSGIAIPGVQPKLPVYYPAGDAHFILKPQVNGVRAVPEIESLWMRLFELLGVPVARSALVEATDGELAYLTRRFDRLPGGEKLHVEDFAQLLGKSIIGDEKFDARVADMANALRERSSPRARVAAVERLFKLTVLNIALGNSDAHLKNHAIIGLPDKASKARVAYTLAPAYDLLPTFFLSPNARQVSALKINGKTRDITKKDLAAEAEAANLKASLVDEVLNELQTRAGDVTQLLRSSIVPEGKIDELVKRVSGRLRSLGMKPLP
jgi:serine/threonine-protein kinase HipA